MSSGKPVGAVAARDLAAEDGADGAVDVADRQRRARPVSPSSMAGLHRSAASVGHVERFLEAVILGHRGSTVRPCRRPSGLIEDVARSRGPGPSSGRWPCVDVEQVAAADHLVDGAEAELGHDLAHFLGDERMKLTTCSGRR